MTQTFAVPAKFIIDGHAEACSTWKEKLERKFPALFTPLQPTTFKAGNRFTIRDSDYILAQTAPDTIALICLENGNRWAVPTEVGNSLAVTVEELTSICNSSTFMYNGKQVKQSTPTLPEFVEVDTAFIKAAHSAATGELKKKVAAQFPEIFTPCSKYVQLIKRPDEKFVIPGTDSISLGEERDSVFMTIANGILPSSQEHLRFRSFAIFGSDVEGVEVTKVGGNWIVAIKRK
jgi:hypothetical protein